MSRKQGEGKGISNQKQVMMKEGAEALTMSCDRLMEGKQTRGSSGFPARKGAAL